MDPNPLTLVLALTPDLMFTFTLALVLALALNLTLVLTLTLTLPQATPILMHWIHFRESAYHPDVTEMPVGLAMRPHCVEP